MTSPATTSRPYSRLALVGVCAAMMGVSSITAPAPAIAGVIVKAPSEGKIIPAGVGSAITPSMKIRIRAYYNSGRWGKETAALVRQARQFAEPQLKRMTLAQRRKQVFVFDIDDTLLTTYYQHYRKPTPTGPLPAIGATANLLKWAQTYKVRIVLLTGRTYDKRAATLLNLKQRKILAPFSLRLRSQAEKPLTALAYKRAVRQKLELGPGKFNVMVNVGDQFSDLQGGYSDRAYKLPNPMYEIK